MAGESSSTPATMDSGGYRQVEFARGGPIYVPNLVGPITSIPDFRAAVLGDLHDLQVDLIIATSTSDEDLSVDDLRVFTEEELVEKALKEDAEQDVFDHRGNTLELMGCSDEGMLEHPGASGKEIVCLDPSAINNFQPSTSLNLSHNADSLEKDIQPSKKKRGRRFDRNTRAAVLEGNYFAKVKEFAELLRKQDEDKLAARLHSFSGVNPNSSAGAISTSDNAETMRALRFLTSPLKVKSSVTEEHIPVFYQEVVVCVEMYDKSNVSKKIQEFLVLGSQLLTELRDNIHCLTDKLMQTAEKYDPSGYFLIEDTFYNDLRYPSATNYTKPIFEWLTNSKDEVAQKWEYVISGELKKTQKKLLGDAEIPDVPSFRSADMHRTRFSDLRFRLGAGYLYCHQGNCKHILVIRDMRLVHPEDAQNRADYPLLTFQLRPRYRKCSVCKIYHATKMTVDDKWAPENPCYFCINCYFLLHYKEDNTLLYPHSVYDYYIE